MPYPFRHDFMDNAVDEYYSEIALPKFGNACPDRILSYNYMRHYWTVKERNDWFAMYVMGGQPYPHKEY